MPNITIQNSFHHIEGISRTKSDFSALLQSNRRPIAVPCLPECRLEANHIQTWGRGEGIPFAERRMFLYNHVQNPISRKGKILPKKSRKKSQNTTVIVGKPPMGQIRPGSDRRPATSAPNQDVVVVDGVWIARRAGPVERPCRAAPIRPSSIGLVGETYERLLSSFRMRLFLRILSLSLLSLWFGNFVSMCGATSSWLRSAQVTNAYTLPVEVRVTYGRYSASANNASRQMTSAIVVFPGDSALFGDAAVQLREPVVVSTLLGDNSASCAQLTLPIDTILACAFPSNDTSIPYSYPDSCASLSAPYASENESNGRFLVVPASMSGGSSGPPVSLAFGGGEPATGSLVSGACTS
jgi:hypothetical protein